MSAGAELDLVVTRFAVILDNYADKGRALRPDWIAGRLDLIRRVGLPSLLAQTRPPERWVLVIDSRLPAEISAQIRSGVADLPLIELLEVTGPRDIDPGVSAHVARTWGTLPDLRARITALDSDDALHRDFLDAVARRDVTAGIERVIVQPTRGMALGIDGELGRLLHVRRRAPQFFAACSPASNLLTPYLRHHGEWTGVAPIVDTPRRDGPLWLEVVHGGNVANDFPGRGRRLWEVPLSAERLAPYGVRFDLTSLSAREVAVSNVKLQGRVAAIWAGWLRDQAVATARRDQST